MIEKILDDYDLKVRVAPGLIVTLPVLVDAVYAAPTLKASPHTPPAANIGQLLCVTAIHFSVRI